VKKGVDETKFLLCIVRNHGNQQKSTELNADFWKPFTLMIGRASLIVKSG